jgi:hypothetical protein
VATRVTQRIWTHIYYNHHMKFFPSTADLICPFSLPPLYFPLFAFNTPHRSPHPITSHLTWSDPHLLSCLPREHPWTPFSIFFFSFDHLTSHWSKLALFSKTPQLSLLIIDGSTPTTRLLTLSPLVSTGDEIPLTLISPLNITSKVGSDLSPG